MRSVTVYGFGSAFHDRTTANDVDLLIVHPSTDPASCQFAITCKQRLAGLIACVHITMLSNSEEKHCQFIKTARAVYLGSIHENCLDHDVVALVAKIPNLQKT